MWIVDPFRMNTFNQAAINMSHNLKFMFQTPPFYGLVLLLPQLRVYGALAWGPDELYITRHAPLNKTLWLWELTAGAHRKTVLVSCPQCKDQYEKVLEDVSAYTPRYMEEMESIFEQSQEEERKRISFLKQAFLSIHRHLDVTNNERWAAFSTCPNRLYSVCDCCRIYSLSVKAVYNDLHQTLMSINEQDDLKWWKNNHGPGMPTDWPKVEVC